MQKPKAITENIYANFKSKVSSFWKTIFKMPFICSRHTSIQAFQYKIIHRTLPCNEWFKNKKIKPDSKCTYCNNTDTITHFLIDCKSNKLFWKNWAINLKKNLKKIKTKIHFLGYLSHAQIYIKNRKKHMYSQ